LLQDNFLSSSHRITQPLKKPSFTNPNHRFDSTLLVTGIFCFHKNVSMVLATNRIHR
jgi:hypothetical protein